MDQSSPWQVELARESAVRRLVRALSLSERFHLYIVTCKAPPVTDTLLQVVEQETSAAGNPAPMRRVDPYSGHLDFTRPMEESTLLQEVMDALTSLHGESGRARTVLDATFASSDDVPAWERLFRHMNERRNTIVKASPGELLLCLPPRLDDSFKASAPDFWSIRSGEYHVEGLPPAAWAVEVVPSEEVARALFRPLLEGRRMEAAALALDLGNEALRSREGRIALWCFRRMQEAAAWLLAEDAQRSEHVEMAVRASLGVSRSLLLLGDVDAAEVAERDARDRPRKAAAAAPLRIPVNGSGLGLERGPASREPLRVFISYAAKDARYVEELEAHLAFLRRRGMIETWHQGKVAPGEAWDAAVREHLERSDLVLLVISADFLASRRAEYEIANALRLAGERGTLVIPVLLRPADLQATPLAEYQALPDNGRPVSMWTNRDEAWSGVVLGIQRALESQASRKR